MEALYLIGAWMYGGLFWQGYSYSDVITIVTAYKSFGELFLLVQISDSLS